MMFSPSFGRWWCVVVPDAGGVVFDKRKGTPGRGRGADVEFLDDGDARCVEALAQLGNDRVGVCRDRHRGKLVDFRLHEAHAAVVHEGILERPEPDADSPHQADLDGLPRLVDPVLELAGLVDFGNLGLEANAFLRRLLELHGPNGLPVVVLPQQRQRVLEGDPQRLDDVAHPVGGRRRGNAADHPPAVGDSLDFERSIGAPRHVGGHDVLLSMVLIWAGSPAQPITIILYSGVLCGAATGFRNMSIAALNKAMSKSILAAPLTSLVTM